MGRLTLLPRHSIASAMLSLNLCLLGFLWSYHILFLYSVHVAQYFCWFNSHTILGFLGPFYSFGHPRLIPILHSHGFLLNPSDFLSPITIFFTSGACWRLHQLHLLIPFFGPIWPIFVCFPFFMIPMGLLLPSLGSLEPVCFLCGIFYYFLGLWTIILAIWV